MSELTVSAGLYRRRKITNADRADAVRAPPRSSACSSWPGSCGPRSPRALSGINLQLFTQMTPPPMEEGGLANAFFGRPS